MPLPLVVSRLQHELELTLGRLLSPKNLARVATLMPRRLNRLAVEQLLNQVFAEQIASGDFDFLQQRSLQVEIHDAELFVGLGFAHGRLRCLFFERVSQAADASLSIDAISAIELVRQEVDPDTLFFRRRLRIGGDTELTHQVKNTIDTLDPEVIPVFAQRLIALYRSRVLLSPDK